MKATKVCVQRSFWTSTIAMHGSTRLLTIALRATGGSSLTEIAEFLGVDRVLANQWLMKALEDGAVEPRSDKWVCCLPATCFEAARRKDGPLYSSDVRDLAFVLADRIRANGAKAPDVPGEAWLNDMRLLVEVDCHSPQDVVRVIRWATADSFWRCNILSPRALRKQYDRLVLRMAAEGGAPAPVSPEEKERARKTIQANPYLAEDAQGQAALADEIGYRPLRSAR